MIDEVIKMKQNKNIVSIFCDETDSTTFLEGYIYAVGVQKFLIKHITPHGLADGYILKELDSIVHLETGGKYERKIEKLYHKKNQKHIDLEIDKNSDLVMDTIEESVNYYNRNQQLVFGAFLIVAIIVVCFSLINLVNTTITNFLSRKREIGMLQAIGLSKKQLIRMLCYEGMIYSLFAVLVTLILGVGFGILCIQIMRSLNPYFFYSFPWPVVLIYSAVLLAVQLILIAYTTGNLKKQSLVDQIRTME